MNRIPEPEELMDEAEQVRAYSEADFSEANTLFLEQFAQLHPDDFQGRAIDLGCGPADIALRFLRRYPLSHIDAIDGAPEMLKRAHQATPAELASRVHYQCRYLPDTHLPAQAYDAVLSNSLLHHLAKPATLWQTIRHCGAKGGAVLVMDLMRPTSENQVQALVEQYAAEAPKVLKRDFTHSLRAAYTIGEVRRQLDEAGLEQLQVRAISDRHLAVSGYLP